MTYLHNLDTSHVMKHQRVAINISGLYFETYEETLARFPNTLLGSQRTRKHYYDYIRGEYYFDRNRLVFDAVLFYYQSGGILSCPPDVTEDIFAEELDFFRIKDTRDKRRGEDMEKAFRYIAGNDLQKPRRRIQGKVWELFYNPSSSWVAGIIEVISVLTLVCCVALSCIETMPSIRSQLEDKGNSMSEYFEITNYVCHTWFTFEYLVRLASAADKRRYLKTFDSMVDICAILPFFVQLLMTKNKAPVIKLAILRVLRIVRLARVLRFTRYFRGMRAITYTIYASWYDLQNFLTVAMMFITLISSLMFYFENSNPGTLMTSIPEAIWCNLNTFTTVGYGDIYPLTLYGKLIGALCSFVGIIFIGLSVYCLGRNFIIYWDAMKEMHPNVNLVTSITNSVKRLSRFRYTLDGTSKRTWQHRGSASSQGLA